MNTKTKIELTIGYGILGFAMVYFIGAGGCKSAHPINHKDSTECAVFNGYPVTHDTEFETWPVFVPLDKLSVYGSFDTLYIDSNGFVVEPLRDAESNQFVTDGLDKVVLHERVMPNRFQLIK